MSSVTVKVVSTTEGSTSGEQRARVERWPLALVYAAGAACLLLGLDGPIAAVLLAFGILTVPGVFVVERVRPRDSVERLVVVIVLSITAWMSVAHLLLSVRWWHPGPVAGVLLAAACVATLVGWGGRPVADVAATPSIRARVDGFVRHLGRTQLIASTVAFALWGRVVAVHRDRRVR